MLPVLYFLGLLCVYIDICNGPCALSCIEKWHKKLYIIIIIIMREEADGEVKVCCRQGDSERGSGEERRYQRAVVAGVFGGQVCDGGGDAGGE